WITKSPTSRKPKFSSCFSSLLVCCCPRLMPLLTQLIPFHKSICLLHQTVKRPNPQVA
ncbi:hypothetical protein AVDCRST_MAG94-3579, partial [uncultured Leptolyngbya sp.]